MRPLLPALAWAVAAGPALGQAPAPAPTPAPASSSAAGPTREEAEAAMQAYRGTEAYKRLLSGALARVPAGVVPHCPKLAQAPLYVAVVQPLRFAPDKTLVGGAWRDSQVARGCGADVQLNYFFFATAERRVLTVVGVPGSSRTDLAQQRDARTYAIVAMDGVASGCASFEVVGTKFEGWGNKWPELADPGEKAPFRPWWEHWTLVGCGKRWEVPLDFRPNQTGTQIIQPGNVTAG